MADKDKEKTTEAKKPRQGRSPAFPYIPLGKALERAETFRVAEGGRPKHFSPRAAIAKAWDMGEKTGPTKQTIAALGYFGLFEFEGSGDSRGARLTETALNILLDKQPVSSERDNLVKQVALTPAIHKEMWQKWSANLPSNPTLETFLVRDRGFSEEGARDLITEYKATIAFAKLSEPDTIPDENQEEERQDGGEQGQENRSDRNPPPPPLKDKLMAGERELTKGLLAKDSTFRLIVSGNIGVKEIERLIQKLELDKEILAEVSEDTGGGADGG